MLALDAMEGNAPEVWAVLTTRSATTCMKSFYRARGKVLKALRRRWPSCEYAALLEFTTGYSEWSGGKRRPHWNLLIKGVPAADCATAAALIKRIWCGHVDAEPVAQYVGPISEAGGLMRYIALHFQKESQSPPPGFTGQRFNCSREYFTGCTRAVARKRARESLRSKREVWKALNAGHEAHDAELVARQALELAHATVWVLTNDRGARVGPVGYDPRRMILKRGESYPAQGPIRGSEGPPVVRQDRKQPGGSTGTTQGGAVEPDRPKSIPPGPTRRLNVDHLGEGVSNGGRHPRAAPV